MKIFKQLNLALLLLVLAATAFAGGGGGDCKAIGSWYGYDESGNIWWTSTIDGQNASHGTVNLEVPGSVSFFPGAFAITELKGQWIKTGENTYDWTVIGLPFDVDANSLSIVKLSGTDTISDDCDEMWISNIIMEVFPPTADINTDPPLLTDPNFPDHPGFRVKVNLPVLLP